METATLTITDVRDIEYYANLFTTLERTAEFGTAAAGLLAQIALGYERTA